MSTVLQYLPEITNIYKTNTWALPLQYENQQHIHFQTKFYQTEFNQNNHFESQFNFKVKTQLCRNFIQKGSCPYGRKCQFAHGIDQLKCNSDSHHSYKTKKCLTWQKKGYCKYGDRCNFLHYRVGKSDLKIRNIEDPEFQMMMIEQDKFYKSSIIKNCTNNEN